jgi:hypothetical protein
MLILFVFRNAKRESYGLHIELPPQLVPPAPPSAWATVGITKVLKNIRAAATTSSIRFTVVFSLFEKSNRDTFMSFT